MMKSFFKKLSLVMALAMVVSMMAPAASAFAADDLIIAGQEEKKADAKESYSVEVGKEVDLKFYNAAAGWQDLYKWESSDETIAKPLVNEKGEQDGRFEGLKDGKVEVTLTIGEQKATVELVVGKGEVVVDNTFTVKQTAGNKINVTFADPAKATDKVELYKIFSTSAGDVEVTWPVKTSVKDGVATVEAYVDFADGDAFVVKANGESVGFVSYVGPITNIKVVAKIGDKAVTYVNEAIKFDVEYYAGDIKVAANGGWMTYEALDPNENIYIDSTYGQTSYIYAVGASTRVKAVYSYYDKDYNVVEIPYEFPLVGMPKPVEAYDTIKAFTITNQLTDASKVAWGKTDLIVGDTGYYVGLNVGTTTDGTYSFNAPIKDKGAYPAELGTFSFQSSDETKLLVGNDGYVTAISEGNAVIIVKLTTVDANGNVSTKNVYAFNVNILPARKATTIKLSAPTVTVLTNDNTGDNALTKATVTYEVLDQYNTTYPADLATVTTTAKIGKTYLDVVADGAGKGKITIVGADYAKENVSSIFFTVEAAKIKATLNVIPKKPATNDNKDVVTTGYAVDAKGLNVNVKAEDIAKTGETLYATVTNYTTWAGTKTGYVKDLNVFANDKFFTENKTGLKAGDLVLKVTGPDGKLVAVESVADGVAKIKVATVASGAALNTIAAGTYNVTLYSVTNVTANTGTASGSSLIAHRQVATTTFKVENNCTQMAVKEYKQGLASDAATAPGVVADIVSFKLGDKDFADSESDITKVTGVYNKSAGKLFVQSIKIKTPINDTGCYFEQTINIGKTFTVTADLSGYNFK
ncbi:MAG: Ig-like domain-containing protein [Lachnospiraceae bacterium]|nr:Ig-like domain-containing protein [Lachnospiraceae bacterium]